jgi:hypothetical protein
LGNPAELPPILKNNPHPEYVELWNASKKLFWKRYWQDKKSGNLKIGQTRRFMVGASGKPK